jgi:hypothetical protein
MAGDDLQRVLRGLERAREFAKSYRFQMTEEYRALIAQVEALPRNQSGADKSGRWLGSLAEHKSWYRKVRPIPRKS